MKSTAFRAYILAKLTDVSKALRANLLYEI